MCYHHLLTHLPLESFHLCRAKASELYVSAISPDRLGACAIVLNDEVLRSIQVGKSLLPVVGVAYELNGRAMHVLFQLEGTSTHSLLFVIVGILIEILFGIDEIGKIGDPLNAS